MKKIKKLTLKRESVSSLNQGEMKKINGGQCGIYNYGGGGSSTSQSGCTCGTAYTCNG